MIGHSAEIARARQQEIEIKARQAARHSEYLSYRRKDGRMLVLRLPRR